MEAITTARMGEDDFGAVLGIQIELFPAELQEDVSILRRRCELFAEGCWAIKADGEVVGYVVSNPWTLACPPMLGTYIERLPEKPDCVYLHDIAIHPRMGGRGLGGRAVAEFKQFVREAGYARISLVAVMDSRGFWEKQGFTEAPLNAEDRESLAEHYGPGACYMTLEL